MNKEAAYIGAELREKREQKKITLEELAQQTKINVRFLHNIEEGDFDFLPKIYTRSFVKLFAEMVGLDPEVYARRFDLHYKKKEMEKEPIPKKIAKEPKKKSEYPDLRTKTETKSRHLHLPGWLDKFQQSRILWFSSGAVILLILLLIIISSKQNNDTSSVNVQKQPIEIPIEAAETQSQPQVELPVPPPQPLKIIFFANDVVWVKYAIDNSPPNEATFYPGAKSDTLVAKEKVTFRVGNSRAISLKINDRMISQIDQTERVANFEATRGGVQKLNSMPTVLQPPVPLQTGLGTQRIPTRTDTSRNY